MSHRRDKTKYNDSLSWNSWILWDSYHLQCLAMRFSGTERVDGLLKAVHSHLCVRRHRQPFSPAQTVQESCHVASMRQPMQFQDQTSRPRSASRRGRWGLRTQCPRWAGSCRRQRRCREPLGWLLGSAWQDSSRCEHPPRIPTPLKNMKVSWDDEIPNIWKIKAMFQTTNQYDIHGHP